MTKLRTLRLHAWTLAVCVVVVPLLARAAYAQTGTAALVGEVTDSQKQVIPGATVTATHVATAASKVTVTDERGSFRLSNMQPGMYTLKVELAGFKTAIVDQVSLQVDSVSRETIVLEVGGISETVSVVSETTHLNTTDASVGNVMSREQIRSLPVEAQNVVHLLSLQPGAIFIPTSNPATVDPRYGSVAGARADQQSVTLDGIDVNDPQMSTAYTSAIRMTQEALQEFRVSTSNYNAEMGRSSGPQVSLITRSGTNQFDGSGYWTFRRTATSTNEYFLELSQKAAGQESKAPKLDKDIFGGSFGGPIQRNKLFFFANVESLKEQSEAPVVRNVPSNSMRDGVLMYQCATARRLPGRHGTRRDRQPHGAGRLVRDDAGGDRRDRSAGHRPEPGRPAVFPPVPVAERSGPRRPQPDGLPLRRADRERLLQPGEPRRLQGRR